MVRCGDENCSKDCPILRAYGKEMCEGLNKLGQECKEKNQTDKLDENVFYDEENNAYIFWITPKPPTKPIKIIVEGFDHF